MADSRTTLKPLLVIFAGAMAITAMVLNGITWSKVRGSINAVESAFQKRDHWVNLLSTVKDAETGLRGYVITGQEEYLTPFHDANDAVSPILDQLRDLARESGNSTEEIDTVAGLVRERMDALKAIMVIRQREDFEAAKTVIMEGKSKAFMDNLRGVVMALIGRHQAVVQETTLHMNRDLRWGYASALGAGLVAIGAGFIAFFLLRESLLQARREQRLAEEKRRAESSDREKSVFLATMSHEIRTPMNAILGFGELLRDHVEDAKGKKYVDSILLGGQSLLQIINDILDLSKVEAGMLEMKPEPTDLRESARFIRQLFSQQAAKENIELRIDVEDDLPTSLLIDHVRLRQILVNVVGNALKFTPSGHVTLRIRGNERESDRSRVDIIIEVEDTGSGIPKEQQEAIFRPFVQAHDERRSTVKGTGLGLAIVQRLTGLLGGTVTMESELGRGSLFRLTFPEVEISARLALSSQEENDVPVDFNDLRPAKILVVDDNATNLDLLAGIFEESHHTLRLASNGQEALAALAEEVPDLVMLDLRMPVMDGREALATIRANSDWKLLPVLAVTASSLGEEDEREREKFDGYIRKPFSRAQLYEEISNFIHPNDPADARSALDTHTGDRPGTSQIAAQWRVVADTLDEIAETDWPTVRDGLAVQEIHTFARKLELLASGAQCGPLATYSRRLHSDADSFSPDALEKTLHDFPDLIALVRGHSAPPSP